MSEPEIQRQTLLNYIEAERWTWLAAKAVADVMGVEKSMEVLNDLLEDLFEIPGNIVLGEE